MSTLTIKNFGPIKNFHAPIARLNVLIGPQASGKSTVAKLLLFNSALMKDAVYKFKWYEDSNLSTQELKIATFIVIL